MRSEDKSHRFAARVTWKLRAASRPCKDEARKWKRGPAVKLDFFPAWLETWCLAPQSRSRRPDMATISAGPALQGIGTENVDFLLEHTFLQNVGKRHALAPSVKVRSMCGALHCWSHRSGSGKGHAHLVGLVRQQNAAPVRHNIMHIKHEAGKALRKNSWLYSSDACFTRCSAGSGLRRGAIQRLQGLLQTPNTDRARRKLLWLRCQITSLSDIFRILSKCLPRRPIGMVKVKTLGL